MSNRSRTKTVGVCAHAARMAAHEPTKTNKGERTGPARFYFRRIGLDFVEKHDRCFDFVQGRSGNPLRRERPRSPELVVGRVPEPAKGFERKANPLEVGIGRINELEPGDRVHLAAGESANPQRASAPSTSCSSA